MPLSFGKPKEEDVVSLIASRDYGRAIGVLKQQLRRRGPSPSLRMQLADVLVLADKKPEAIALLLPLADEFANEGFAAKAVSVLKKIQRIDPRRRDVGARLAQLIEEKQREAARPSFAAPAARAASGEHGPALEIGLDSIAPVSAPAVPHADPSQTLPVESAPLPPPAVLRERTPADDLEPARGAAPPPEAEDEPELLPDLRPLPGYGRDGETLPSLDLGSEREIADYDLLYLGDTEAEGEETPTPEPELIPEPDATSPMSAVQFADELMALVDDMFQESPAAAVTAEPERPAAQIVVSPLFRDFSVDEMVAVIAGLKLLSFERGDVILREGDPGASLYTLTAGRVRAFKKDPASGKQRPLGDLDEGAFFGEMSILSGRPRTASVVALSRCELLELDRPTLEEITQAHPHVWDVLREFAAQRTHAQRQ